MISPGEPSSLSGQDLLAEFSRGGHEGPFEEIVRRYAGMVYNACLKITRDKHEAEDATQAVFLTLAVQVKRGTDIKALGPWLQQVAKRLALDMRRSQKRRKRREEQHYDLHTARRERLNDAAVHAPDVDELKVILHEELQKLPAKYRMPLILHYFGGLTREEMAGELNCKPSTLGVRIFRGRQMLAGKLSSRRVSLPDGPMGLMMGLTVNSVMTDSAIRGTGHAVAAVASGHPAMGLLSMRVIALSRRASAALLLGKIKLVVAGVMLVGMSIGACAKAAGMLPELSVQRLIVEPLQRLLAPLVSPISTPMQASAIAPSGATVSFAVDSIFKPLSLPPQIAPAPVNQSTPSAPASSPPSASSGITPAPPISAPAITARTASVAQPGIASSNATKTVAQSTNDQTLQRAADAVAASTSGDDLTGMGGGGGGIGAALPMSNNLYLPPTQETLASSSSIAQTFAAVVEVPTQNGKLLERGGVLRGYGRIARTGTFDANGKIIADGGGIDRSLDLTSFNEVECSQPNPTNGENGWYAVDHGRLDMKLQGEPRSSVLTWGDSPDDPALTLVNSVRLQLTTPDAVRPGELSLLALDRDDLPSLIGMIGTPIGLWEVDSPTVVAAADVTVRYDDAALEQLGASEYATRLWFYTDDRWRLAAPASFHLDVKNHLLSGEGGDFSYFAVTAPGLSPYTGNVFADNDDVSATALSQLSLSTTALPEPSGLLALATLGLGYRRRRSAR